MKREKKEREEKKEHIAKSESHGVMFPKVQLHFNTPLFRKLKQQKESVLC